MHYRNISPGKEGDLNLLGTSRDQDHGTRHVTNQVIVCMIAGMAVNSQIVRGGDQYPITNTIK